MSSKVNDNESQRGADLTAEEFKLLVSNGCVKENGVGAFLHPESGMRFVVRLVNGLNYWYLEPGTVLYGAVGSLEGILKFTKEDRSALSLGELQTGDPSMNQPHYFLGTKLSPQPHEPSFEEFKILIADGCERIWGEENGNGVGTYLYPAVGKRFSARIVETRSTELGGYLVGYNQWSNGEVVGTLEHVLSSMRHVGGYDDPMRVTAEEFILLNEYGVVRVPTSSRALRDLTGMRKDSYIQRNTLEEIHLGTGPTGYNQWSNGKVIGTLRDVLASMTTT